MSQQNPLPSGWDEERVEAVRAYYEGQSEEEAVAEDEACWEDSSRTLIEVPSDLVPAVQELLAKGR